VVERLLPKQDIVGPSPITRLLGNPELFSCYSSRVNCSTFLLALCREPAVGSAGSRRLSQRFLGGRCFLIFSSHQPLEPLELACRNQNAWVLAEGVSFLALYPAFFHSSCNGVMRNIHSICKFFYCQHLFSVILKESHVLTSTVKRQNLRILVVPGWRSYSKATRCHTLKLLKRRWNYWGKANTRKRSRK
jgi:hypothetical protein